MEVGIKGRQEVYVNEDNTALELGSGELEVFATPAVVSLIEKTAWKSIKKYLIEGQTTVGSNIRVTHLSASPIGIKVWCETELIDVDNRKLTFKAEVFDEKGLVARGVHERFIVDIDKFLSKAKSKLG